MLNEFYNIQNLRHEPGSLSCDLVFNAGNQIFAGHFPGNPIVPGVCTLAVIKALLEQTLQRKLLLHGCRTVKFLGLISPAMSPKLSLIWTEDEDQDQLTVSASLQDGADTLFKMSGGYIPVIQ